MTAPLPIVLMLTVCCLSACDDHPPEVAQAGAKPEQTPEAQPRTTVTIPPQFQVGNSKSSTDSPRAQPSKGTNGHEFTLVTYNLLFRGGKPKVTLNTIKETPADVLLLQEITPSWRTRLEPVCSGRFGHKVIKTHTGTHGFAIYSKYPIRDPTYLSNEQGRAFAQCAKLDLPSSQVAVCNGHTASPAAAFENPDRFDELWAKSAKLRTEQWHKIVGHLGKRYAGLPAIVAGDLNTLTSESLYDEMIKDFVDTYSAAGKGSSSTFPNLTRMPPFPVVRLDYVLVRGVKPKEARVLAESGSDHLAVLARLRL